MQEIQPTWWRILLKDAATRLYARVDFVKRTDDSLDITVSLQELSSRIVITFAGGEVTVTLLRYTGNEPKEVAKEVMKLDGKFVWQEEDHSN